MDVNQLLTKRPERPGRFVKLGAQVGGVIGLLLVVLTYIGLGHRTVEPYHIWASNIKTTAPVKEVVDTPSQKDNAKNSMPEEADKQSTQKIEAIAKERAESSGRRAKIESAYDLQEEKAPPIQKTVRVVKPVRDKPQPTKSAPKSSSRDKNVSTGRL